ncbi:MAG: uracil-DNA glycosylase [Planctomycetaceae bacterium]|jgi:DNA polymerase|nr:uracil-DNA glycosylase [Planctomycetaceae bacterium]
MNEQIRSGLIDYLMIMRYAGVTEVSNLPINITNKLHETGEKIISVTKNTETTIPVSTELDNLKEETELAVKDKDKNIVSDKIESVSKNVQVESELLEACGSDKLSQLKLLSEEVACCSLCSELVRSRTQTVFGTGNPDTRLLFLGEAPGADEDIQGEPFVGRSGKLLDDIITKGMKMKREDVYICNILRCRPPNNRTPAPEEATNCKPFLEKTIKIVSPKFICCLGSVATRYLLQTEKSIGLMRRQVHDYNGIKVICTYHPSYLLRMPAAKKDTWDDIKLLMKVMEEYGN